jgi:hypothetical protein
MSITVDEMLLAKAKLEQELQAVITEKTDLFWQETGVPIANVAVYSERFNAVGAVRFVVTGVRCDLDLTSNLGWARR